MSNGKYPSAITNVIVNDATFKESAQREFVPTYVNYFYGNNGTGKTSISRTIQNSVGITFEDDKSAADFLFPTFNEDFVKNELNFENSPNLPGVLMVGKDDIAVQQRIDELEIELTKATQQRDKITFEQGQKDAERGSVTFAFRSAVFNKCKSCRNQLKAALYGFGSDAKSDALIDKVISSEPYEHNFEDIKALNDSAFDKNAELYSSFRSLDLSGLASATECDLLGTLVISTSKSDFAVFIKKLGDIAMGWVERGANELLPKSDGYCPFCQRKMPDDFEKQLTACFDEQYKQDINRLRKFWEIYKTYTEGIISVLRANLNGAFPQFEKLSSYTEKLTTLESIVALNLEKIISKGKEASSVVELENIENICRELNALIEEFNRQINENNNIVRDKKNKQNECTRMAWQFLAFLIKSEKAAYELKLSELDKEVATLSTLFKAECDTISGINREIGIQTEKAGSSSATVKKVNTLLIQSGFRGFQLNPHRTVPDKYEITRSDGSIANKLIADCETKAKTS